MSFSQLSNIYRAGRYLGDASSLLGPDGGIGPFGTRIGRRVGGKGVGRFQGSLSVFGLIMWAEFLSFLRHEIEKDAARPYWVGSFATYAAAIEKGFTSSLTGTQVPAQPYFDPAVRMTTAGHQGGGLPSLAGRHGSGVRSGLYEGGKYVSSIKAFARGDIVGRVARVGAGQQASKFFWGTLRDPERNIIEGFMLDIKRQAKRLVPVDKGVLRASIQTGATEAELKLNSVKAGLTRIDQMGLSIAEAERRLYGMQRL